MTESLKENTNIKKIHNYLLLLLLFVFCICVVLYVCKVYKTHEEEKMKVPIIRGFVSEIYSEDLEHYVLDNPTSVIYMCVANGESCRSFERNFKKFLQKRNYNDQIVYLNLTDVDQGLFVNQFNDKYHYKIKLTSQYPAFVLFEDGEVKGILQENGSKPLTITKLKHFLELNEIGE